MHIPILVDRIDRISLLQQFRQYFKKISDKLDHHEFLFMNSFIIAGIACIYMVFLFVNETTSIEKMIKTYGSLTITEISFLILLSLLTVISGVLIYEMNKNYSSSFLNSVYIKIAAGLGIIGIFIFMYKESYKLHQFIGVALILSGLLLSFTKNLQI
jgi:drug/metabolite transporter (DMT)-like permease